METIQYDEVVSAKKATEEIPELRARLTKLEKAIVEFAGEIEPKAHHPDELLRLIEISRESTRDGSRDLSRWVGPFVS